jgi:hypothetical protein
MIVDVDNNHLSPFIPLSPARGRGGERGLRTSIPPLLTSPPSGGEEHEGSDTGAVPYGDM